MLLPLSPWHNNLTMTSWFWWNFWPTHANCHTSIDRAWPALLVNAWQLAQVGQNGRQKTFAQAGMRGCWVPPLSLLDNINIYFINKTHYFNTQFYIIIKLYQVRLACYFGGVIAVLGSWRSASWPSNMWLLTMRYVTPSHLPHADVVHWHPSATPPRLSLFATLSSPTPAHFWLVVGSKTLIGGHLRPQCIFFNYIFVNQLNGQNDGAVTPRTFHPSPMSYSIYKPPRMPTSIWLLYIFRKWWPPKANAPPISLFFDVDKKVIPNKGTGRQVHKPSTRRLQRTHGEMRHQDLGAPLPYSRRERVKLLEGRAAVVHFGCSVMCVVGCGFASRIL
jgi:hypothetical protein